MATYYVDAQGGSEHADGLSPESAIKDYRAIDARAGDRILFRRGGFMRDTLDTLEGEAGAPITYGAWGEGAAPIFCLSVDLGSPSDWKDEGGDVWSCTRELPGEIGNLIFDGDRCEATLRWSRDGLVAQGDFFDEAFGGREIRPEGARLLLFSKGNPATVFSGIEAAAYSSRRISKLKSHTVYEDLEFINSGVHALQGRGVDITVRRCAFRRIGGCVWSPELRVRFGNGVELWNIAEDVTVEDCVFENIYDSCVTHQGGAEVLPARRFICRRNRFDTYGMAAFEYRDRLPIDSSFTDNICERAGCGFAMRGESLPRLSEIWPEPMGHHIFLWRIKSATEGGSLLISRNRFGSAPVGAAIYSIISPEAEAQIVLRDNLYERSNPVLSVFFGGRVYTDGAAWQSRCSK